MSVGDLHNPTQVKFGEGVAASEDGTGSIMREALSRTKVCAKDLYSTRFNSSNIVQLSKLFCCLASLPEKWGY